MSSDLLYHATVTVIVYAFIAHGNTQVFQLLTYM